MSAASDTTPPPLLEARGIGKRFGGVAALERVDLTLGRGEVLALVGENGAGKSTLMKILAGVLEADAGELRVDGRIVRPAGVLDALALGIALIHQELQLHDNLDVAENVFLGREPRRGVFRDAARMRRESAELTRRIGLDVLPTTPVGRLSIGQQQMVEIAKALACDARVLIMDEPTSSLSLREAENLFHVVADLRARGVSVIYVSHRLGEVKALADRVTVLRDGRNAGEVARDEISHDRLVRLMVGRAVSRIHDRAPRPPGDVALAVEGLRTRRHPEQTIDLEVRAGEIVGIAGLVGAGRTELLEAMFGIQVPIGGSLRVRGRPLDPRRGPRAAIGAGLALVPEDRKRQGVILDLAIAENFNLPSLERQSRLGLRDRGRERELSARQMERLDVRAESDAVAAGTLSGGNQQKVVLGKWLAISPSVLLLDEPTRGVDIGAKEEIYRLLDRLTDEGVAVLFASSEMEEILGLADRVVVMCEGRIAGELSRAELSEEAVMRLATSGVASGAAR